jgi:hypothetical protein
VGGGEKWQKQIFQEEQLSKKSFEDSSSVLFHWNLSLQLSNWLSSYFITHGPLEAPQNAPK